VCGRRVRGWRTGGAGGWPAAGGREPGLGRGVGGDHRDPDDEGGHEGRDEGQASTSGARSGGRPVHVHLQVRCGAGAQYRKGSADGAAECAKTVRQNDAVQPIDHPARVVVLAGPSGSGKSRLAATTGLPVLRLDDFYRSGDDPGLPTIAHGSNAGLVDWDDPRSWHADQAVRAICELAEEGRTVAPVYDISRNGPSGTHEIDLAGGHLFVAEGIFAQEIVRACADRGVLAAALCLRQRPLVTFWRRLTRDLREHRKPPLVLLRRGWALMRDQRRVIEGAVALGCEPVSTHEAAARIRALVVARAAEGG
jgi:uridine kinase